MSEKTKFRIVDALYIAMMILPFAVCIVLKVLFTPPSDGVSISGALIYFTLDFPIQKLYVTEAQVNSAAVIIFLLGLCLYLTHGMKTVAESKRQHLCEMAVSMAQDFVDSNMGKRFSGFAPFVAAIMALSAISSLTSLLGLFPPTSDLNIVGGWAILVFFLITYYKLKGGVVNYAKGFLEPFALFAPFNVISEFATPISMAFRHYGNVLSGTVISVLVAAALGGLTNILLGWLPWALGEIQILRIGIPAVLSLYFDLFSGLMQAFIFAMLTMLYISNGFSEEDYEKRMQKKAEKKKKREQRRKSAQTT